MRKVTDYEDFLNNGSLKSNLSEDLRKEFIRIETLIKTGVNKSSGKLHNSGICCQDLNIGKNCPGTIYIKKTDIPHKFTWECSICTSAGKILNWRKSPSYKDHAKIKKNSGIYPAPELILSKRFYNDFKELCLTEIDFYIILNNVVEKDNCFQVHIAEFDMLQMLNLISDKINSNSPDREKYSNLRCALIDSYSPARAEFY